MLQTLRYEVLKFMIERKSLVWCLEVFNLSTNCDLLVVRNMSKFSKCRHEGVLCSRQCFLEIFNISLFTGVQKCSSSKTTSAFETNVDAIHVCKVNAGYQLAYSMRVKSERSQPWLSESIVTQESVNHMRALIAGDRSSPRVVNHAGFPRIWAFLWTSGFLWKLAGCLFLGLC